MTTRQGEPLEAEQQSVESILRPLAEATVPCWGECESWDPPLVTSHDTHPDPRFEALRRVGPWPEYPIGKMAIDASLGAIVRAAAACGWQVTLLRPTEANPTGEWVVDVRPLLGLDEDPYEAVKRVSDLGYGVTPEEAAARALVTAWGDEKEA